MMDAGVSLFVLPVSGLLHLARGIQGQAFVHSGDKVSVCLAVKPDYTMSVEVC